MRAFTRLIGALRTVFRRGRLNRDLDQELRASLDLLVEEKIRAGLSPLDALRAARLQLGGFDQIQEQVRDARIGHGLETALQDVRLGWRSVRRAPGFSAVVIATLALGIGANTAIFSVVHALLVEPPPYRDPGKLMFIWSNLDRAGYPRAPLSGLELRDLRDRSRTFESIGAIWATTAALTGDGDPEQLRVGLVTTNFFSVLGVDAALGRTFVPSEEGDSTPPVIILSHALWQRRFAADARIVGRRILLNGFPTTVVGVMPPSFAMQFSPDANVPDDLQAWRPFGDLVNDPRTLYYLRTIGRLGAGVSIGAAQEEIARIGDQVVREFADYSGSGRSFFAVPLQDDAVREVRPALVALLGGVSVVLLIACVNVAGLLIARAAARRNETAVRVAIGAGRVRLARQLLAEGLMLAILGATAGVLVGWAVLDALVAFAPESFARIQSAAINLPVLACVAVVAVGCGVLFSMAPLAEVFRIDVVDGLRRDGRGTGSRLHYRTRATLVVVEIALGVVLLVSAGLLIRAFTNLQRVDPGFTSSGMLTFRLALPGSRYRSLDAVNTFSRRLEEELRALPGVSAVGAVSHLPFDTVPNWSSPYMPEGVLEKDRGAREADARAVNPGFFAALGAGLVDGRFFTESDDHRVAPVVIVDERLASRTWPNARAVGKRINVDFLVRGEYQPTWATVVGVVRHLRHRSLSEEVREQVYMPFRQLPRNPMAYVVRTSVAPATIAAPIRRVVFALDKDLPVYDVRPLATYVNAAVAGRRFTMTLASAFAVLALTLACIGIYGLVAYSVARRRHEFGVRLALGAGRGAVVGLVVREGLALSAIGLAIGIAVSTVVARLLSGQLFVVTPLDARTYLAVTALLPCAAFLASWLPARRAAGVSPIEALKIE